ncbi:MAG: hypothetical protein FWD58_01735 [Firmicutes bacterium]|nr:hypothetical protein [Bacillota bacterium]
MGVRNRQNESNKNPYEPTFACKSKGEDIGTPAERHSPLKRRGVKYIFKERVFGLIAEREWAG